MCSPLHHGSRWIAGAPGKSRTCTSRFVAWCDLRFTTGALGWAVGVEPTVTGSRPVAFTAWPRPPHSIVRAPAGSRTRFGCLRGNRIAGNASGAGEPGGTRTHEAVSRGRLRICSLCHSGHWPMVPGDGIEPPSPVCKTGALPLDEPGAAEASFSSRMYCGVCSCLSSWALSGFATVQPG